MDWTPAEIFYALYAFNLLTFIWEFYLAYRQVNLIFKKLHKYSLVSGSLQHRKAAKSCFRNHI